MTDSAPAPSSRSLLLRSVRELFRLSSDTDRAGSISFMTGNVEFRGASIWALVLAILIASVGLNVNSTAVVIGAMLISPPDGADRWRRARDRDQRPRALATLAAESRHRGRGQCGGIGTLFRPVPADRGPVGVARSNSAHALRRADRVLLRRGRDHRRHPSR